MNQRGRRMTGKLIAIADSANPDGSHDVTMHHDGQEIAVNIPRQRIRELIAKFQVRIFEEPPPFPQLTVDGIEIACKDAICELVISTIQTGAVVLAMSDADLRRLKKEIDRVLAYRALF